MDKKEQIDLEWFHLILEAKQIGLSIKEVRDFINEQQYVNNDDFAFGSNKKKIIFHSK